MSALREDQVEMAMRFLGNEKVAPRPVSEKEGFLERKGLTKKEIAEAFKRFEKSASSGDAPSAAADSAFADAAASAAVAPAPAAPAPAPPQMPAPGPAYPVPQYSAPDPGAWASPAGPYGPPPPWANFQGYGPPPEPPPSSGGPWWVWLLGGLGAGLAGTLLANPLRRSDEGYSAGNGQQAGGGAQQYAPLQLPAAQPLQAAATSSKAAEIGGEIEGKASYEELLALLRQQSEEARENAAMCSKALQTTQEQHQKMFAEMQKALQTANQQRTAKPQPTELSAATVQALASLIRDAPPASSAPPPPSSGFDVLPPLGVDALGGAVPMAGPGAMALGPVPGHFGAVASAVGMPMGGGVPGLGGTSLRESFDAINLSLQRLVAESSTKVEATKSLNTVSMILGNILKDPTSDKHPKVNTTSARFSELFRNNGAASDLLKLAGFQYQEPNFTFGNGTSPPSVDACQRTLDLLQEFQRNIDQAWAARQSEPGPQAVAPADAPADEVRSAARPWATGGSAPSRPPNVAPLAPWATLPGSSQYSTQGFTALPSAVAALPSVLMQDGPSADDGMAQLGAPAPSGEFQSSAPIFSGGAPASTVQAAAGVAHPAESQPPAMAHPAEASPTPAPPAPVQPGLLSPQVPVMAAPPAAAAPAAALPIQQLPIAHPAEVAPVVAAHPAEAVSASEEPQSGG